MSKRLDKSKAAREPRRKVLGVSLEAFEETKKLYDAWLGYLLTRIGADTLRVKTDDITAALEGYSCAVTCEGDEYVISVVRRPGEPVEGAVGDSEASTEDDHE